MSTSVHSLLLHILLLSALLSIPISGGGSAGGQSRGYSVFLSTEAPTTKRGSALRTVVTKAEDTDGQEGQDTLSVEDSSEVNRPLDDNGAALTDQKTEDSEADQESTVKNESLLAGPPVNHLPAPEENHAKQDVAEKEKMAQTASQNTTQKVEKADLSENKLPAARNVPEENAVSESDQINESEKKTHMTADPPLTLMADKAVMTAVRQREMKNTLPKEEMPVPVMKQKEPERGVKTQAGQSSGGLGLNDRRDPHHKGESKNVQAAPVAPKTSKEYTAPSGMKETASQNIPDVKLSPEPNPVVSEEKPLQDMSVAAEDSAEMTLPTPAEEVAPKVIETAQSMSPPSALAKNAQKNNDPKADLSTTKKVAESGGKIVRPKSVTIPGEPSVEKKVKARVAEESLSGKDHPLVKGNEGPPARDSGHGVHGTQTLLPAVSSEREEAADRKKDAGGDRTVTSALRQTTQKVAEEGGTKNVPDALPKSVGMGPQKSGRELQTSGGEKNSLMRLAGNETGKNRAALNPKSKLSGRSESPLEGSRQGPPIAGTENKQPMQPDVAEGPANGGGSEANVFSDTGNRPQSAREKTTGPEPAVLADMEKEAGKKRIGIPVPEALIQRDIRIEVFMEGIDKPAVLTTLLKKSHPKLRKRRDREEQKPVEGTVEETMSKGSDKTGTRLFFSVTKVEKATYTFVLENKVEQARTVDVIFRFYEGREKERDKEYHSRELAPGGMLRFMFIMPEGTFWDDEDRFSGMVEDSRTITKFNNESGLVWKEDKGH